MSISSTAAFPHSSRYVIFYWRQEIQGPKHRQGLTPYNKLTWGEYWSPRNRPSLILTAPKISWAFKTGDSAFAKVLCLLLALSFFACAAGGKGESLPSSDDEMSSEMTDSSWVGSFEILAFSSSIVPLRDSSYSRWSIVSWPGWLLLAC